MKKKERKVGKRKRSNFPNEELLFVSTILYCFPHSYFLFNTIFFVHLFFFFLDLILFCYAVVVLESCTLLPFLKT